LETLVAINANEAKVEDTTDTDIWKNLDLGEGKTTV
jgi:hypothetical protein